MVRNAYFVALKDRLTTKWNEPTLQFSELSNSPTRKNLVGEC